METENTENKDGKIDEFELKNLAEEKNKLLEEKIKQKSLRKLKWKFTILILIPLVLFGYITYLLWTSNVEKTKSENYFKHRSDSLEFVSRNISDSLHRYSSYKVLYTSIQTRDAATKQLKHQVGDVIYCKPDSLRSVITDVIIGGSKYDYYVKYKIKTNLGGELYEVIPEQIY